MSIAEKLTTIAENQQRVYDKGKQSAYDEFWDLFQQNGNRTNYQYGICGYGWTVDTFKPKYSIIPTHANGIFQYCGVQADLGQLFKDRGLTLDLSKCTNSDQMFTGSYFTTLPILDFRKVTSSSYITFSSCTNLTKIELIMLSDSGNQKFSSSFNSCSALADIRFSGVIGQTLDMKSSPLNKASIENIIEHLSSTATGMTLTLKKSAKEAVFTDEEWITLITPKSNQYDGNWTISLV